MPSVKSGTYIPLKQKITNLYKTNEKPPQVKSPKKLNNGTDGRLEFNKYDLSKKIHYGMITLTLSGYHDPNLTGNQVDVEVSVLNTYLKKGKNDLVSKYPIKAGVCHVPCNSQEALPNDSPVLSIPFDKFISKEHKIKSCFLLFEIGKKVNSQRKGSLNSENVVSSLKRPRRTCQSYYFGELLAFDKPQGSYLLDGEYHLVLESQNLSPLGNSVSFWKTLNENVDPLNISVKKGPYLTFYLSWTKNDSAASNLRRLRLTPSRVLNSKDVKLVKRPRLHITYLFSFAKSMKPHEEIRNDFKCIWCEVDFHHLESLLLHFESFHKHFTFSSISNQQGITIKVFLNEDVTESFVVDRKPDLATLDIVTAAKASAPEELEPHASRPYFHSDCNQLMATSEIGDDTEEEDDPEWLREKTQYLINDFIDVNEGEKELMKMWNLHLMKYGFVGYTQLKLACSMFVEIHGKEIFSKNLYKNFLCHLSNLFDNGVISSQIFYSTILKLQQSEF